MTPNANVSAVAARLEAAKFERAPGRFKVAAVTFDFPAVLIGGPERGTDLIVVIDTTENSTDDPRGSRVRQRLEALALALDVADWRVVITVVLVGGPLPAETIEDISRICRVLTVSSASVAGSPDASPLDDRLRVLLPLNFDAGDSFATDPIGQLSRTIAKSGDARLADALISASVSGEDEVRRVLAREIERAVSPGLTG